MGNIYIVNNSNLASDAVASMVAAVQAQLDGDFQTHWGATAQLVTDPPAPGSVVCAIEQTSDSPGALGYHSIDADGIPFARIFVDDSVAAGVEPSSVLSHEILELMADRYVDAYGVFDNGDGTGVLYAFEDCDPVENDIIVDANGVSLSNCVTPAWFDQHNQLGPWDFAGNLKGPFTMTSGGYVSTRPIQFSAAWAQQFADSSKTRSLFG